MVRKLDKLEGSPRGKEEKGREAAAAGRSMGAGREEFGGQFWKHYHVLCNGIPP